MTDTQVRDRDLMLADDGQEHTAECVTMGWWLLDWEAACADLGVAPGGPLGARQELATFAAVLLGGA